MTALDHLVDGLFDYAGLYPPANLALSSAAANYLTYAQGPNAHALGRFVVDLTRVDAVRDAAGDCFQEMKLSVVAAADADWHRLAGYLGEGAPIDAVEIKVSQLPDVESLAACLPAGLPAYVEVPIGNVELLDAACATGMRVKLRMGGVTPEAFPTPQAVAAMLHAIAERHLLFKATAGLHHPLRSPHAFTYASDSATGMMHGFVNLCCAAALLHAGGEVADAAGILAETDRSAWRVGRQAIAWRDLQWSAEQIRAMREEFFANIGSCSFTEPIADLEALGWR